ncbi:kinase-like domain-containing protein [Bisporella sp. PMI_857]|nr:kinase-like domain-containing protein [Bisporella sp. PMI_857]
MSPSHSRVISTVPKQTSIQQESQTFPAMSMWHAPSIGAYQVIRTLGEDSLGKVKLAVHRLTNQQVVLKIISRKKLISRDMAGRVEREIDCLQLLRHPHIIELYTVIKTQTEIIMVLEYAGGELFDHIVQHGKMQEDNAMRFFQQIICAVEYCHRNKIVHGDLKPENLLLDSDLNVKIADFGLRNILTDGAFLTTNCGSPNYAAPEVIGGQLYVGAEVDAWSCGVILYVLLVGRLPFDDEHIPSLFAKISKGHYKLPSYISHGAASLIKKMLTVNPVHRATMEEILRDLRNLPDYLKPPVEDFIDTSVDTNKVINFRTIAPDAPLEVQEKLHNGHVNKIGVLPSSLPAYHKAFMDARKAGRDTELSPSQFSSEYTESHIQSTVEQAETARRPKPTSRSRLKLDEAKRPAGMTPVPAKKPKPTKGRFGIRFRGQPLEGIGFIYRALQKVGAEWILDEDYRPNNRREGDDRRDQDESFASNDGGDGGDGGPLHHASSVDDDTLSQYKLPPDPWVIRARWRKDGMYPPGTAPPGSTHLSQVDLRRHSIASLSSASGSLPLQDGLKSTPHVPEPTDAVVTHLDIQLYEMERGVYIVDFKCVGYETAEGTLLEEKDAISPFPFLDFASELIIQLSKADESLKQ